jgi:hypothetical protein
MMCGGLCEPTRLFASTVALYTLATHPRVDVVERRRSFISTLKLLVNTYLSLALKCLNLELASSHRTALGAYVASSASDTTSRAAMPRRCFVVGAGPAGLLAAISVALQHPECSVQVRFVRALAPVVAAALRVPSAGTLTAASLPANSTGQRARHHVACLCALQATFRSTLSG